MPASAEQRLEILKRYIEGKESVADLSEEYGVSKGSIYEWAKKSRQGEKGKPGPAKGSKRSSNVEMVSVSMPKAMAKSLTLLLLKKGVLE